MNPCPACGHPVAIRIGLRIRCGNPACRRFDERLEDVDAGRPATADPGQRVLLARALTPPGWVRWLSGLGFMLVIVPGVLGFLAEPGAKGWIALLGTLPFVAVGILILFSGRTGRKIAEENKAQARLRADTNLGCTIGLIAGIGAFAVFSLIVCPILDWGFGIKALRGIPLEQAALILLVVVGAMASLWGGLRARAIRRKPTGD